MKIDGQRTNLENVIQMIKEAKRKGCIVRTLSNPYNPLVIHLDVFNPDATYETYILENLTIKTLQKINLESDEVFSDGSGETKNENNRNNNNENKKRDIGTPKRYRTQRTKL